MALRLGKAFATGDRERAAVFVPDTGTIQTEVEVLKSPRLAIETIRDLKLHSDPEFNPAAVQSKKSGALTLVEEPLLKAKQWLFSPQNPPPSVADAAAA